MPHSTAGPPGRKCEHPGSGIHEVLDDTKLLVGASEQCLFPLQGQAPTDLPRVTISTDGSSFGNPGPAGWAAVLRCGAAVKDLAGSAGHATANRAELLGILGGLGALRRPCAVTVFSDSRVSVLGCMRAVLGIGTPRRTPLANADVLREIAAAAAPHRVEFVWVRGHVGDLDNERADDLARQAAMGRAA